MSSRWDLVIKSLTLLTIFLTVSDGAKILLLPVHHGSHARLFSFMGDTLQKDGHEVHIMLAQAMHRLAKPYNLHILDTGDIPLFIEDTDIKEKIFNFSVYGLLSLVSSMSSKVRNSCETVLSNEKLLKEMELAKYDLILMDNIDWARCFYVIPHRLGVPYISVGARHDPWKAGIPALPSAEGQFGIYILNENSSFWERLANTAAVSIIDFLTPPFIYADNELFAKYAPNKPETSFEELYRHSEMWLITMDTLCLDFPRIYGYHYQFIAGLGTGPPQNLTGEIKTFVETAPDDGIIVLTFGSAVKVFPDKLLKVLLAVFRKLPQRIIMRLDGEIPADAPSNVMFSKWVPQNDLLGHPKTKLFITHGGNNGQLEAQYHGVPMLIIPLFGDQWYNARRATAHGHSLTLYHATLTEEELEQAIMELLNNPKYRETIQRCSNIAHDMPEGSEMLKFWVNHILKYGSSHLKPASLNMPKWKLFMIDIIVFTVIVIVISLFCLCYTCRRLVRCCCQRKTSTKPKRKQN